MGLQRYYKSFISAVKRRWVRFWGTSIYLLVTWWLPDKLIYWCGIRLASHASTETWPEKVPNDIGMVDMLQAWVEK